MIRFTKVSGTPANPNGSMKAKVGARTFPSLGQAVQDLRHHRREFAAEHAVVHPGRDLAAVREVTGLMLESRCPVSLPSR
jgi:hypothetical protein